MGWLLIQFQTHYIQAKRQISSALEIRKRLELVDLLVDLSHQLALDDLCSGTIAIPVTKDLGPYAVVLYRPAQIDWGSDGRSVPDDLEQQIRERIVDVVARRSDFSKSKTNTPRSTEAIESLQRILGESNSDVKLLPACLIPVLALAVKLVEIRSRLLQVLKRTVDNKQNAPEPFARRILRKPSAESGNRLPTAADRDRGPVLPGDVNRDAEPLRPGHFLEQDRCNRRRIDDCSTDLSIRHQQQDFVSTRFDLRESCFSPSSPPLGPTRRRRFSLSAA